MSAVKHRHFRKLDPLFTQFQHPLRDEARLHVWILQRHQRRFRADLRAG